METGIYKIGDSPAGNPGPVVSFVIAGVTGRIKSSLPVTFTKKGSHRPRTKSSLVSNGVCWEKKGRYGSEGKIAIGGSEKEKV